MSFCTSVYNFFCRALVFQSVIIYGIYCLYYSNTSRHASNFKDELASFVSQNKETLGFLNGVLQSKNFDQIFESLLFVEIGLSIFSILGIQLFGFINALIVFAHGFIMYNPLDKSKKFQSLFGLRYEFILLIGLFLSMMVVLTSTTSSCCEEICNDAYSSSSKKSSSKKSR